MTADKLPNPLPLPTTLMKSALLVACVLALIACTGCSTTQEVLLAKAAPTKKVVTVAQVPDTDNSNQMTIHLESALRNEGISVKAPMPPGTRKSSEVDAFVSYVDVWRWDIVMFLKSISIKMYDAETGDLLVVGQWTDSPAHGYRDAKTVVQGVVTEMVSKLRSATSGGK